MGVGIHETMLHVSVVVITVKDCVWESLALIDLTIFLCSRKFDGRYEVSLPQSRSRRAWVAGTTVTKQGLTFRQVV